MALVEWCAVWQGSVKDCLDHLRGKHDGVQFLALKNLGKLYLVGSRSPRMLM